jgi:hypothetical protein
MSIPWMMMMILLLNSLSLVDATTSAPITSAPITSAPITSSNSPTTTITTSTPTSELPPQLTFPTSSVPTTKTVAPTSFLASTIFRSSDGTTGYHTLDTPQIIAVVFGSILSVFSLVGIVWWRRRRWQQQQQQRNDQVETTTGLIPTPPIHDNSVIISHGNNNPSQTTLSHMYPSIENDDDAHGNILLAEVVNLPVARTVEPR